MKRRPGLLRARPLGLLGSVALAVLGASAEAWGAPDGSPAAGPESVSTSESVPTSESDLASESESDPTSEPASEPALPRSQEDDIDNVETPIFPQAGYRDALRLRIATNFLPNNDFGLVDVSLYSPDVLLRFTVPLTDRAVLQMRGQMGASHYDFSGTSNLFGTGPTTGDPLDPLYRAGLRGPGGLSPERRADPLRCRGVLVAARERLCAIALGGRPLRAGC